MNQKIKTLIVGVDLSKYSKIVVKEAKLMAKKMRIPLIYVYVFQDIFVYQDTFVAARENIAEDFEKQVREKYHLHKDDQVLIKFGRPYDEIISAAKKFKQPMIIVGHRGQSPITRFFIGSTAERLALLSPIPVWIHRGEKTHLPKRVLVPCDLSKKSEHTVKSVATLKEEFGSEIELYHVTEEPVGLLEYQLWSNIYEDFRASENKKFTTFQKKHLPYKTTRGSGNIVKEIQARAKKFDVVAISPRANKTIPFFGNVTAKIVRSGQYPVLVIP